MQHLLVLAFQSCCMSLSGLKSDWHIDPPTLKLSSTSTAIDVCLTIHEGSKMKYCVSVFSVWVAAQQWVWPSERTSKSGSNYATGWAGVVRRIYDDNTFELSNGKSIPDIPHDQKWKFQILKPIVGDVLRRSSWMWRSRQEVFGRHRHAALASNFYKLNLQMYDCPGLHLEHTPLVSGGHMYII